MAIGHLTAHARVMGAISHKRYRQFVVHEPSRANAPEGFLFSLAQLVRNFSGEKPERETRIPGLARKRARPKRGACSEGTRRKPDTDGRANQNKGSLCGAPFVRAPRDYLFFNLVCRVCGSMNAGGEDIGYFDMDASGFDSRRFATRTVESAPEERVRRGFGSARLCRICVAVTEQPDFARSPACLFRLPMRRDVYQQGGGEDVCYFG
jgi:hypothetical protein